MAAFFLPIFPNTLFPEARLSFMILSGGSAAGHPRPFTFPPILF